MSGPSVQNRQTGAGIWASAATPRGARHERDPKDSGDPGLDVVGYSRLAGADEDRTLARLRALRSDLIDPTIAVHHGRVVKRTGDGSIIEFRSVVDAARCAIEVQSAMVERNAGVSPDKRIEFRVGVHLGDGVEESDGDLMGDGVNIAARLEGVCEPGGIVLSSAAYEQARDRLKETFVDLGEKTFKNIARPVRVYAHKMGLDGGAPAPSVAPLEKREPPRLSLVLLPFANIGGDPEQEYFVDGVTESLTTDLSRISGAFVIGRSTAFSYKGKSPDLRQIGRDLNVRYVLEGSVQRGGNRMRVNMQLIEAETGRTCGPSGSTSPSPTFLTCRMRSFRASPTGSAKSSLAPKRAAPSARPTRTLWITTFWGLRSSTKAQPPSSLTRRGFTLTALSISIRKMSTRWSGAHGSIWALSVNGCRKTAMGGYAPPRLAWARRSN